MDAVAFHKEAHDAEIKAWAGKTASVVDEHLKMARDIRRKSPPRRLRPAPIRIGAAASSLGRGTGQPLLSSGHQ